MSNPQDTLTAALTAFPEDDARHWDVQAFLFHMLAHKAQQRGDEIRRRSHCTAIHSEEGMRGFYVCVKNVGHDGAHLASDGRVSWTQTTGARRAGTPPIGEIK
jgi:hypothetical protein